MRVESVSRSLGLTMLRADMTEAVFWSMTLEARRGFVAGWPFADGTTSLAVKSKSLKSFLATTRTRKKASVSGEWETPKEEPAGLARYQRNWQ